MPLNQSVRQSVCPTVHPCIHLSVRPSVCLSIRLSVLSSVHQAVDIFAKKPLPTRTQLMLSWIRPCFCLSTPQNHLLIISNHMTSPVARCSSEFHNSPETKKRILTIFHFSFLLPPIPSFPIVKSSHSELSYLDFSRHIRASIGSSQGPPGGTWRPLSVWKWP